MTHRDELEALRARVETQEKDLRDARAELDVLRAAVHVQAMPPAEPRAAPPPGAMGFGPGLFQAPGDPRPPAAACGAAMKPALQRQLGVLMILTSVLLGGLVVSSTCMSRGPRRVRSFGPPSGAVAVESDAAWSAFVRHGTVTAPGEPVAVDTGTRCSVTVTPTRGGRGTNGELLDCRVEVRCDERLVYGTSDMSGFAHCGTVPSFVVDELTTDLDGDPAMTLDLASDRVTVEERVGLSVQRLEITLDPLTGT